MKSTTVKCLIVACVIALTGCLQKPLPPKTWNDSMSSPDGSCLSLVNGTDDKYLKLDKNSFLNADKGLCSTKLIPEVKMYKYPLSSDKKMREVISAAALKCYWYVAIQGPGELTLTYWGNDSKQLIYSVHYDKNGYTLTYEDSASMHYNEDTGDIHPLADLWFLGGETYGLYGLKPTLESLVRKAYEEENARGKALFGTLDPSTATTKKAAMPSRRESTLERGGAQ